MLYLYSLLKIVVSLTIDLTLLLTPNQMQLTAIMKRTARVKFWNTAPINKAITGACSIVRLVDLGPLNYYLNHRSYS